MTTQIRSALSVAIISAAALLGACPPLLAAPPTFASQSQYQQYLHDLQIAQLKVNHLKALREGEPGALSTSLVMSVLGRYYQVGDHWDVVAWKQKSTMAAMNSLPVTYKYQKGLFHYEVVDVKPGNPSQVTVRITQKSDDGAAVPDPKVEWLDLTMTNQFSQDRKVYHFVNQNNYWASPNGVHTNVSPLELFPLDVPDIYTADRSTPTALPDLPAAVSEDAKKAGFSADLSQSSWFDQQDMFGRSIQILWQKGDLWPAYMKTATGIEILARH